MSGICTGDSTVGVGSGATGARRGTGGLLGLRVKLLELLALPVLLRELLAPPRMSLAQVALLSVLYALALSQAGLEVVRGRRSSRVATDFGKGRRRGSRWRGAAATARWVPCPAVSGEGGCYEKDGCHF